MNKSHSVRNLAFAGLLAFCVAPTGRADSVVPEDGTAQQLMAQLGVSFSVTFMSDILESAEVNDILTAALPILGTRSIPGEAYGQLVDTGFVINPNLTPISTVTLTDPGNTTPSDYVRSWNDGFNHFAVNFTSDPVEGGAFSPPAAPVPEPSPGLLVFAGLSVTIVLKKYRAVARNS